MWFYDDKPSKRFAFDEEEQSTGFADPLGDAVFAFAAAFIVALIAYLTWAYQNGTLPLSVWWAA